MKILTVVGARPQFIKAAPVERILAETPGVRSVLVHTGQHFDPDMSDCFFHDLDLPTPAHHLGVREGGHGAMTGRMLAALEPVMEAERPDWTLVYGDTNSTLAAALAAAKLGLPVAHVEAGLRSFNRSMPEEINRVLTDHLSALLFCPTQTAVDNLAREGIRDGIHHVGDVMYDAALHAAARARAGGDGVLGRLGLAPGGYLLATVHRAENTDDPERLEAILAHLRGQAETTPVVMPLHPRTRKAVERFGLSLAGLEVIGPVGYPDMCRLLASCAGVLTDSGGLQKEAYFHRKPCVTLREETEWTETVEAGWNRLWRDPPVEGPRRTIDAYGDGDAARRIVALLLDPAAPRGHARPQGVIPDRDRGAPDP